MKRVALITGGTRGIGFGIALQLTKAGFDLAVNGIRPVEQVTDTINELKSFGNKVIYCQCDISSPVDRNRMVKKIQSEYTRLHILVNNAGIAPKERKDILEASEESFTHVITTNLQGPYFLTQSVANWMIAQQKEDKDFKGCIINITSVSATVASVNRGEYCIAKAGLNMATKLYATRLGEFNIPVYEIQPGVIRTDMTAGVTDKYDKLIENGLTVQQRWGEPEDVGKAVAALALDYFPYSTGQVFLVDGGLTVQPL